MTSNVKIIDSPMGSGKTSSIIKLINNNPYKRYVVIVPLKSEIDRVVESCPQVEFHTPELSANNKCLRDSANELLASGKNIVTTHALFSLLSGTTLNIVKKLSYTVIMDEVEVCIEPLRVSKFKSVFLNVAGATIDPKTGKVILNEDVMYSAEKSIETSLKQLKENDKLLGIGNSVGEKNMKDYEEEDKKFLELLDYARRGCLYFLNGAFVIWVMPEDTFRDFNEIYLLTYMFECQVQKFYFDLCNISYTLLSIDSNMNIVPYDSSYDKQFRQHTKSLLKIMEDDSIAAKGNAFGSRNSLSASWYRTATDRQLKQLGNLTRSYFINRINCKGKDAMWSTFKNYREEVTPPSYKKSFISVNCKATNIYSDRHALAYLIDKRYHPAIKTFFLRHEIKLQEDLWSVSELLQWIYRSAIRKGEPVTLYLPSKRMRTLLNDWLNGKDLK